MQQEPNYLTRVPLAYFVTSGYGDTDYGGGLDPWHTGSFDLALAMGGIENFNIVLCSSVIPPESYEIPLDVARPHFRHGAVMEAIMAAINGRTGETVTAGLGRVRVRDRRTGACLGGFAAEYEGHGDAATAARTLRRELEGIALRRYDAAQVDLEYDEPAIASRVIQSRHGTAIAALCWLTYSFPQVTEPQREALRAAAKTRCPAGV
ncbi:pyruvoyl-dependent arginine decarboxylase [Sorangium sp. So ce1153]|uniref:pyruvoyl-dependent arginine decarboxylase n=1 Tax=Sorangium sp. So ce1153 TaxID=3133333 RepID=UPI003F644683